MVASVLALLATGCHHTPAAGEEGPDAGALAFDGSVPDQSADVTQDRFPPATESDATCASTAPSSWNRAGPPLCPASCAFRWDWTVEIDPTACIPRVPRDCATNGPGDRGSVGPLAMLADQCQATSYVFVRAEFFEGCATRVLVAHVQGPRPEDEVVTDCIATALAAERWSCAIGLSCSLWETDTLP
jgi:hypothetical protein